jgi:hypothetical protein
VTIDAPVTLSRIGFDSSKPYALTGTNPITIDAQIGMGRIDAVTGNHAIAAPLSLIDNTIINVAVGSRLSVSGPLNAMGKQITKDGQGALTLNSLHAAGLFVHAGTVVLSGNGTDANPSVLDELSIMGGAVPTAQLDLSDHALVLRDQVPDMLYTLRSQIIAGRGGSGLGKHWNGNGISSSAAAAANAIEAESRSVAYARNGDLPLGPYTTFRGQPVDGTSLLIAFTRTGDANLDGLVNDDDVTIVGASYAPGVANPHWALGDFDYNGFVDDDDVTLLGAFYDPSASPFATSALESLKGVAAVPEPSTIVLLAALAVIVVISLREMKHRLAVNTSDEIPPLAKRASLVMAQSLDRAMSTTEGLPPLPNQVDASSYSLAIEQLLADGDTAFPPRRKRPVAVSPT